MATHLFTFAGGNHHQSTLFFNNLLTYLGGDGHPFIYLGGHGHPATYLGGGGHLFPLI